MSRGAVTQIGAGAHRARIGRRCRPRGAGGRRRSRHWAAATRWSTTRPSTPCRAPDRRRSAAVTKIFDANITGLLRFARCGTRGCGSTAASSSTWSPSAGCVPVRSSAHNVEGRPHPPDAATRAGARLRRAPTPSHPVSSRPTWRGRSGSRTRKAWRRRTRSAASVCPTTSRRCALPALGRAVVVDGRGARRRRRCERQRGADVSRFPRPPRRPR